MDDKVSVSNETMTRPLVSIVTPAYNQAEYLVETIESVLAQDYPRLEYIVLDDGSTDGTPEILQRYADRIRYERHPNMGQARTLNRGWSMSRGTVLGYLSSDDRLAPQAVSLSIKKLLESPMTVVVYCDFELIDAFGKSIRSVRTEEYDERRLTVDLVCQPGPGALFRREVFERTGGWAENLRQVPDFEFWLRASRLGRFVRVPESLADYRIHEGSASFSVTTTERSMEIVKVVSEFWRGEVGRPARQAMATAHLIAARSHGQSGRAMAAIAQWLRAFRLRPNRALSLASWRMILSGFLRRAVYRRRRRSR